MITLYASALVCIVGAFVYILSTNGKAVELGRIAFFCGLLVALMTLAGHVVHLP
jgi:Na+/phosphate symporter